MAESRAAGEQNLAEKLESHLTCPICLDTFQEPKLLQCFYVFCRECLERLVVQDGQGSSSLRCPTCRRSTALPSDTRDLTGILQPAFHVHALLEIQDALEKLKEPQKCGVAILLCEKCTKTSRAAVKYCQDCCKYVCEICTEMHGEWEDYSSHKLVTIEEMQGSIAASKHIPPKKGLHCSRHKGREVDLYCESCEELICLQCTVDKHYKPEHRYALVTDVIKQHKGEITASLAPVEEQLCAAGKMLEQLDAQLQDLDGQQRNCEACIQQETRHLQDILERRKSELLSQLHQQVQVTTNKLKAKKDKIEVAQSNLASCLEIVKDSLKLASHGEIMKMKRALFKQIQETTKNFNVDTSSLTCETSDVKFLISDNLTQDCQQFGDIIQTKITACTHRCYATGKGLEMVELGERATVILHVPTGIDDKDCTS